MTSTLPARFITHWGKVAAFGVSYFLSAQVGHTLTFHPNPFTAFWPPSGVYVAALLLSPLSQWPALMAASLLANLTFDLAHGRAWWVSLLFWMGNSAEAVAGAWLLRRFSAPRIFTIRNVIAFGAFSAVFSTFLSATAGTLTLALAYGVAPFREQWLTWWTGDMVGVLIVAPMLLAWGGQWPRTNRWKRRGARGEAAFLLGGLILSAHTAFSLYGVLPFAMSYLMLPFVFWAALRFEVVGAALTNLCMALLAVGFTSSGMGQFAAEAINPVYQALAVQSFVGIVSFTNLLLAAVQVERQRTEAALVEANRHLTTSVSELKQRNRDIALLNELSDHLQACQSFEEAYAAIVFSAQKLFPEFGGQLARLEVGLPHWRVAVEWGGLPEDEHTWRPEDCWALRHNQPHWVDAAHPTPHCRHMPPTSHTAYVCLPLTAQERVLGLLHLRRAAPLAALPDTTQQLVLAMAEAVQLALANLSLRETLRNQALHDPLTGLYNRRYMEEMLARELHQAQREGKAVGLIMLDLDHFKHFNDTYGHKMGDRLLGAVGGLLQLRIRRSDVACRYGGEEFLIILPTSSLEDTRQHAEQIRLAVKQLMISDEARTFPCVTVSLGVAQFPEHGTDPEALMRAADTALYSAKAAGRDCVRVFAPGVSPLGE